MNGSQIELGDTVGFARIPSVRGTVTRMANGGLDADVFFRDDVQTWTERVSVRRLVLIAKGVKSRDAREPLCPKCGWRKIGPKANPHRWCNECCFSHLEDDDLAHRGGPDK